MCRSWCSAVSLPHIEQSTPVTSLLFPHRWLPHSPGRCRNAALPWLASLPALTLYSCLKMWGDFLFSFCLHNVTFVTSLPVEVFPKMVRSGVVSLILVLCLPLNQILTVLNEGVRLLLSWFCCCPPPASEQCTWVCKAGRALFELDHILCTSQKCLVVMVS